MSPAHFRALALLSLFALPQYGRAQYTATYDPTNLPPKTEAEQLGTNDCGTENSQESMCQNVFVNAIDDFCLWGPPYPGPNSTIGETEPIVVSWCLKSGYGTRLIPANTLTSAHFLQTPDYVQITGLGDLTSLNIPAGDMGGELDPHGADGLGNPRGGLVFGNSFGAWAQYHEWTSFMAHDEFCIRACRDGPDAATVCNHVYDVMGCRWNLPGNYDPNSFTSCDGEVGEPMGVYGSSTWPPEAQHSGNVTPPPHDPPSSSNCRTLSTLAGAASFTASGTGAATARSTSTGRTGSATATTAGSGTGTRATGSGSRTSGSASQTATGGSRASSAAPPNAVPSPLAIAIAVVGMLPGLVSLTWAL